jgi:colanic acid/amylovoran biosynthesis protein
VRNFLDALHKADLLVVCGAGGFADDCRDWNLSVLAMIRAAADRGIPIALFGQSLGPLRDPEVLSLAKTFLARVHFLGLRGNRGSSELVDALGIDRAKVQTTGDEAVLLAYEARPRALGDAIGINLRVAPNSNVGEECVTGVRSVLLRFSEAHRAAIVPIPTAFHAWAGDHKTIQRLLAGIGSETDAGFNLNSPLEVIKQTGRCRIVLAGAYHAAVFALSQGVPVVCLANSEYFLSKFQGLEDQFGCGCETILLRDGDWERRIYDAMERAWESADAVRNSLHAAAFRQIQANLSAYERLAAIMAGGPFAEATPQSRFCQNAPTKVYK